MVGNAHPTGTILNRRVGELDAAAIDRLQQLSVSQLEDLLDAALDFSQMGDLTGWLDAHR